MTPFSFLLDSAELEFDTPNETLRPMISTTPQELIRNADSSLVPDLQNQNLHFDKIPVNSFSQ